MRQASLQPRVAPCVCLCMRLCLCVHVCVRGSDGLPSVACARVRLCCPACGAQRGRGCRPESNGATRPARPAPAWRSAIEMQLPKLALRRHPRATVQGDPQPLV
eukprot:6174730-Pleurochrysis_carterae.AAC.1